MVELVSLGFSLSAFASSLVAASVAVQVYRTRIAGSGTGNEDLVRPFLILVAVFSVCTVGFGVWELFDEHSLGVAFFLLYAFFVPWTVFALRYAGRSHLLTRRRIVGGLVVVFAALLQFLYLILFVDPQQEEGFARVLVVLFSVVLLGAICIMFITAGLVLLSTYRHGTVSLASGLAVVAPIAILTLTGQVTNRIPPLPDDLLLGGSFLTVACLFVLAVTRYDVLEVRPGTGTLGERAAVENMNEAIFVVGEENDIARANERAQELFGSHIPGEELTAVVDYDIETLAERETIECWTEDGRKRFDPRVSTLTNSREETLGHTITLIDITDREIRRQRLQVLNRILRHNIRNDLDVIKAHAEHLEGQDSEAETILSKTDSLERLSTDARRIEELMKRSQESEGRVEAASLVESVVESVAGEYPTAEVSVAVPDVSLRADRRLLRYALLNVVENAVIHNDGEPHVEIRGKETDESVEVVVADDGPGIPDSEREVIEAGSEGAHAHASSLGLWGTNWAIQRLGGTLSFGESDLGGAAVTIELPTIGVSQNV